MAGSLEFAILGPLEVRSDGRPLELGAAKQRALLALLLLSANELVPADRLVDELWAERPPATASHSVQVYVSQLRKLLTRSGLAGAEVIVSRPPGYLLRVAPEQFDLRGFETLVEEAGRARGAGDAAAAADLLRQALALWRGPALADLIYEPFVQTAAARLEEIRLTALERRIEADLLLGRHADLVGELEQLVSLHPLRERLHGQLMLALYRSGRQAEALDAYRRVRRTLSEELGLEPSLALQQLERAILRQDPELEPAAGGGEAAAPAPDATERSILLLELGDGTLERLLALGEPLARLPRRELILMALVVDADRLPDAVARLHERRAELLGRGLTARAAAFTTTAPGADAVRAVAEQDVDVLLVAGSEALLAGGGSSELGVVLDRAACHVGVLFGRGPGADGAVVVPFGGAEDDWAAVELAAWLARGRGAPLRLVGTAGDRAGAPRDASRLLASASLAIQRVTGIPAEPRLVASGMEPLLEAAEDAFLIVVGLAQRWRREGIGPMRLALARQARAPTLFVRGSLRPGGLAPQEGLTRYTWSLASGY